MELEALSIDVGVAILGRKVATIGTHDAHADKRVIARFIAAGTRLNAVALGETNVRNIDIPPFPVRQPKRNLHSELSRFLAGTVGALGLNHSVDPNSGGMVTGLANIFIQVRGRPTPGEVMEVKYFLVGENATVGVCCLRQLVLVRPQNNLAV